MVLRVNFSTKSCLAFRKLFIKVQYDHIWGNNFPTRQSLWRHSVFRQRDLDKKMVWRFQRLLWKLYLLKKVAFPLSTSLLQNIPAYKPCKDMPIIFNDMLVYFNCNFETFFSITEKRFWFILLFSFSNEKSNPSTKNKLNLQLHNYLQKARFQGKQLICTSHFSFLQETFNRAG